MEVQEEGRTCLLQELYGLLDSVIFPLISRPLMGIQNNFRSHLDFGCGKGWWTYYAAIRNPKTKFIGYDSDSEKIRVASQWVPRLDNLEFTDKKINARALGEPFTSVGSSFVFHEAGETMFDEYRDFAWRGDVVFVIDYNLKGVSIEEFVRLSASNGEKRFIKEVGFDEAYYSHTRFNLTDCCAAAEEKGFKTLDTHELGKKFFCWIGES